MLHLMGAEAPYGAHVNPAVQGRSNEICALSSPALDCNLNGRHEGGPMAPKPGLAGRLKKWARALKRDVHAVYLAARDPRTPWYAKALALLVAGYALSPIDLIPDFIPVVGYLDDLILVPAGIWLVIRLIPPQVMAEHRERAAAASDQPVSRTAVIVIICVWGSLAAMCGWLFYRLMLSRIR
jgi:uncharacterized membrane protein YkvA (DUF1232 family)